MMALCNGRKLNSANIILMPLFASAFWIFFQGALLFSFQANAFEITDKFKIINTTEGKNLKLQWFQGGSCKPPSDINLLELSRELAKSTGELFSPYLGSRSILVDIKMVSFTREMKAARSWFLKNKGNNDPYYILLDCKNTSFWRSELAHEMVHALFSLGRPVESWAQEMIAQKLEVLAGGIDPLLNLQSFNSNYSNALLGNSFPLGSKENYGLSFAFLTYLENQGVSTSEIINSYFAMERSSFGEGIMYELLPKLLAGIGLREVLRNFYLALFLNSKKYKQYQINLGIWQPLILSSCASKQELLPLDFMYLAPHCEIPLQNKKIEVYKVMTNGFDFVIKPVQEKSDIRANDARLGSTYNSGFLIFNPTETIEAVN